MPRPVAEFVEERLLRALDARRQGAQQPTGHYASNIGHPCMFYLWAEQALWEQAVMPPAERAGLFELGNEFERIAKNRLEEAGFEILEQQALVVDEELGIRGRIDWRLRLSQAAIQNAGFLGDELPLELTRRKGLLVEAKGLNQNDYERIGSVDDMLASEKPWVRKWPSQLLFYVEKSGDEEGAFLFTSKITSAQKVVMVHLAEHGDELAGALARVRRVNSYLKLGKPAPALPYTPGLCARCDWAHVCPTMAKFSSPGEALTLDGSVAGPLEAELLATRDLATQGKRYAKARDNVKEMLEVTNLFPEPGEVRLLITPRFTVELSRSGTGKRNWKIAEERSGG